MGGLIMKYSKWSACFGFLAGMLFFAPAMAQNTSENKGELVDCSHLTAEQMGDKDACWNVKKAEMRRTSKDSEAYVEIVTDSPGTSLVNVAQPALSDDTIRNIYEVPFFKSAVPSALSPSSSGGKQESGNQ